MALDRQEKALREFKQIMSDLVHLLQMSTEAKLVYMCWVNHQREQFVWETNSTQLPNVMFQDRMNFEHHFLDDYKDIKEIIYLKVGEDISKAKLIHYLDVVDTTSIIIIPFITKGETVALTIVESNSEMNLELLHERMASYNNAMVNVLETYLELVDLNEQQGEWVEYETALEMLNYKKSHIDILKTMLNQMQRFIYDGGVILLARSLDKWRLIMSSDQATNDYPIGLIMDERSLASEVLEAGVDTFSMHFNSSPVRISKTEGSTTGASYAMPISIFDVRQALIIAYDQDPLTFKESTKHKLSNLARVAALNIQATTKNTGPTKELLTQNFGGFVPEVWEAFLEQQIKYYDSDAKNQIWFGIITPNNVENLRARYSRSDLIKIQNEIIKFISPDRYGYNGFIGDQTEYIYPFVIQDKNEEVIGYWIEDINTYIKNGLTLSNGQTIDIGFNVGYTSIRDKDDNAYQILARAKRANSSALKENIKIVQV